MFDVKRLEYDKVLNIIKQYCLSDFSRKILLAIRPSSDPEKIQDQFEKLGQLKSALDRGFVPTYKKYDDMTDLLRRAAIEQSALAPDELVQIRDNIRLMATLKRQLNSSKEIMPLLAGIFEGARVPIDLQDEIDAAIDEHGRVRDDASQRLSDIVEKLKGLRERIERLLERYIHDPETRHYLQEGHITVKDDRYVIPVKQNFKGRIPGVIHAHSGSDKTIFVEPYSIVDMNNEIRLLQKEREKELRRILIGLTRSIRKKTENLQALQEVLCCFDILMAKARFMDEYNCTIPEFSDEREIELSGARHPLLTQKVVPIDFRIKGPITGVVITGPNTGGKTVSLKTIGLLTLLAQSGIPVPASNMKSSIFNSVYSDIGDESSIEQSLSTFSAHIKNIKGMLRGANERSLVLIDELGAGTDPIEGGALGTAILNYLIEKDITTVVTTHFSYIKMYAIEKERAEVASVEFDPETCSPTYRLIMGIPGRSNALEIAEHLGLHKEVLRETKQYLTKENRSIDGIFKNLALMEKNLKERGDRVSDRQKDLDRLIEGYEKDLEALRERERSLSTDFQKEFSQLLTEYRKRLELAVKEIREEEGSRQSIMAAKGALDIIEDDFSEFIERLGDEEPEPSRQPPVKSIDELSVGDFVSIKTVDGGTVKGKVVQLVDDRVSVHAGGLRLTVGRDRVEHVHARTIEKKRGSHEWDFSPSREHQTIHECDIRGMRYEEAMGEVNRFLDNAVLNNIRTISIIHGLGTGALREGVQNTLRMHRDVSHWEYARPEEGGYGCTIVTLKS